MESKEGVTKLLYKCQFRSVVKAVEEALLSAPHASEECGELILLKASALIELQRLDEAREIVKEFSQRAPESILGQYSLARILYLDEQYDLSKSTFESLLASPASTPFRGKILLGLANIDLSLGNLPEAGASLLEMQKATRQDAVLDLICVELLKGHLAVAHADLDNAESHFNAGLSLSSRECSLYLQLLSFYGLAVVKLQRQETSDLRCLITLIFNMANKAESIRFLDLVNRRFAGACFGLSRHIKFDENTLSVQIGESEIELNRSPMIFRILFTLNRIRGYVSKETIATNLWPSETYNPNIHDQRIFDLIRRTRSMLESHANEPFSLISSTDGYYLKLNQDGVSPCLEN